MKAGEMSKSESVTRISKAELALSVCVSSSSPPSSHVSSIPIFETIYGCLLVYI